MNKKTSIKKEEDTINLEEAFVKEDERVLDPSLIDKSVIEDCYQDAKRFKDQKHWCEKGQWILIGRYAGSRFKLADDSEVRIINDDEVIATILNPDDIVSA